MVVSTRISAKFAASFAAGLLFGLGLTVSQMINPSKVIGFLDFAGNWDPTLAFVMGGALVAAYPGTALARRWRRSAQAAGQSEPKSFLGQRFQIPNRSDIDFALIGGSALFGVGWGLSGLCPGPALAALSTGLAPIVVFVVAMLAGMAIHRLLMHQ